MSVKVDVLLQNMEIQNITQNKAVVVNIYLPFNPFLFCLESFFQQQWIKHTRFIPGEALAQQTSGEEKGQRTCSRAA